MGHEAVFVDTSAFYALMDGSDKNHEEAERIWRLCLERDAYLRTSNYVIIETTALLQSRLGMEAATLWNRDVLGVVETLWIDESIHAIAHDLWVGIGRRNLSLVDCVSFTLMRRHGMERAFAFDLHFAKQGFQLLQ